MGPDRSEVEPGEPLTPPATILLVEDEVLLRWSLAEFLRDCGYVVFEAANAGEAKAILVSEPIVDLVLSDIQMPGSEDGIRLAQWIESNFPKLPVILTSGHGASLLAARSLCPGVFGLLEKPAEHGLLLKHVAGAVAHRTSR
jgi:DNA-binding NtrC family response regulator